MPWNKDKLRFVALLAVATVTAILVSVFQKHHSYFFEVTLLSSRAETARIYYDSLQGVRESFPYQHHPGSATYRFPLPTGVTTWITFSPLSDQGTAKFGNAVIVDRRGRVIRKLPINKFHAGAEIENFAIEGDLIALETITEATKPSVDISLDEKLKLPKLGFDLLYNVQRALVPFLVVLFGGLAACSSLLRDEKPRTQAHPSTGKFNVFVAVVRKFWQRAQSLSLTQRNAVIILVAAAILVARLPDRFFNAQFWAEDALFFTDSLNLGIKSLITPYGGYLLLGPRLPELLATALPLEHVPLFLNFSALGYTLMVIGRTLSSRNPLLFKPLLAFAIAFVPRPEDILLAIENAQWPLALAFILLLLSEDARTWTERIYDIVAAALCGLTGVFSVLLLPLFALRVWHRRSAHSILLLVIVATTACVQLSLVARAAQLYAEYRVEPEVGLLPAVIGYQLGIRLFGGDWIPHLTGLPLQLLGVLIVSYWLVVFDHRGSTLAERIRDNYLLFALLIVLAAAIYRFKNVLFVFTTPEHIARYFFLPHMAFAWLLVQETTAHGARRAIAFTLLFAFLFTSIANFRAEPLWDYDWRKSVEQIRQGENVSVPINPPRWYFQYIGKPNR